jgi:hypothetical protein
MVVGLATFNELGATFLNWSFHYLSGDSFYYQLKKKTWLPLPDNPLTGSNAHLFERNHPLKLSDWKEMVELFLLNGNDNNFFFYGAVCDSRNEDHVDAKKYRELLKEAISFSLNKNVKIIYIGIKNYSIYKLMSRAFLDFVGSDLELQNKKIKEAIKKVFSNVPNLEFLINSDGGARDFLAMGMRNLESGSDLEITQRFLSHKNFLFIELDDLLKDGENCMYSMFDFLNIKLDGSQLIHWHKVYDQWKEYLLPTHNFYNDLPIILSSIVNGVSFSLKKYRLDVFTEAIIQHELMKKYNNRLLVSHIDSFPEDAKDLTKFLLRKEKI